MYKDYEITTVKKSSIQSNYLSVFIVGTITKVSTINSENAKTLILHM